jgi:polyribonucleotide nucleotidyltransferase
MDFKVAGTREWVTAIQLDMKVTGLPAEALAQALKQAREARLFILDSMLRTISGPRDVVNPKAPRILTIQIPVDKIGEVIGPKGKRINEIIAATGADIDIQDDGTVFIGSREGQGADQAAKMIDEIANPRPLQVGETFNGKVVKTTTFGAFVNLVPGRDGLVHISKLGRGKRLSSVEESGLKEGDMLEVEIQDIDPTGRISLKPIGEEWAIPEGMEPEPPRERRDRGPRDRDRGRGRDRGPRPPRDREPRTRTQGSDQPAE